MESGRVPVVTKRKKALEEAKALEKAEKTPQSGLANKLLGLWAQGLLSAVMIRELADLALQDGASHEDLVSLAKAGAWGQQPGNSHRQIMSTFCPQVFLPEGFPVKVVCIDPKTSLEKEEHASIFLPHLKFASLGTHYPAFFHEQFSLGKGSLEKFWAGVEASGDDRLQGHPMCLEKHWREKTIPIFVHGDGVEYQSRDNLLVFSWGGLLASMNSLKEHMLLAAFPKSCTSPKTWPAIWKVLRWSLESLGKGIHPSLDWNGKPLEKGSPFYAQKGSPLHPKHYRCCVWSIIGDHEYYANILHLTHWASHYPCWECDAESFAGADPGKDYKNICLEKQTFQVLSHQNQLDDPWSDHDLFKLPHVSCKNVRGDPMHILFCKGIYSHVAGGCLHYACWHEGPAKKCAVKPWERLSVIFGLIQEQYRDQKLENRLTNLKLSMFSDPAKPWATRASLDCKAGEAKHLLPALVPVLEKMFEGTSKPEEQKLITAASSLEKLVRLWDEAGTFLSGAEYGKSLALGKEFLDAYQWLHLWSLEKGRNSFAIVAKHHTFIHLVWNSRFMNPTRHWCFKGEDFVGHISKMAHSVSFGVSSIRLSQKITAKYRVLVHFLLTREMHQNHLEDL